jgi:predicted RNA-binding Zn-ribbon protein involved in translation (DUF1610 family)
VTSSFFLCKVCAKEISDGVKFCPDCGASQIVKVEEKTVKTKSNQWSTQKGIAMSKKKALAKKRKQDYSKCNVSELKEILKEKKLPVSGTKSELIGRLMDPDWRPKTRKAKMSEEENEIGGKGILAFIFFFYLMGVYFNYGNVKEQSRRRLSDGSYTSAKEITEFTSDEIMQILITNNNNLAVVFPFMALFLMFVGGVIGELFAKGSDSWSESAMNNNRSFFHLYIVSFLIPIAGIIIGAFYMINEDKTIQNAGSNCILVSLGAILLYWTSVFSLFI